MLSFEQFRNTGKYVDDLMSVFEDDRFNLGDDMVSKGIVYLNNALYIEDASAWPNYEQGSGGWYLLLGRHEWQTDDLESLERRLYQYAIDEQFMGVTNGD